MTNKWYLDKNTTSSYLVRNEDYDIIDTRNGLHLQIDIDGDRGGHTLYPANSFTYQDIQVTLSAEKIPNSDYINIHHTVSNKGTQTHIINLLVNSNIKINGTEKCNQHNIEGSKGVEFQANPYVRFILRNSSNVTNVDTYSYHQCGSFGPRNSCTDWIDRNANARIYFSWQNQIIQPNAPQKTFSYSIGTGEYPKRKVICNTQIESRYDTSSVIALSISVESIDPGQLFSISRQIFDSLNKPLRDKEEISNQNDDGTKFTHDDIVTLPNKPGNYIIRYTVKDPYGEETTDVPIFVKLIPTIEFISAINYTQKPNSSFSFKVEITADISFNFSVIDDKNSEVFYRSQSINVKETKEITVEFNLAGYSEGPHPFRLLVTDDMGYTNETTFSISISKVPTLILNTDFKKFYMPNEEVDFSVTMNDDTNATLCVKSEVNSYYFFKNYFLNNEEKTINNKFQIKDYEVGSNHTFSIYLVDEFELISEIYNHSFTVIDGSPMIKLSDVMHPISIESRNMKISAFYYIWPGSSKATFVSTINKLTNITLQQVEDFTVEQWNPIELSVSDTYLERNTNNNISFYAIDSLSRISNTVVYTFVFGNIKCDYTNFYRMSSFAAIAAMQSGKR